MVWTKLASLKSTVPGPQGAQGLDGVNAVDNDEAVASYLSTTGTSASQQAADARYVTHGYDVILLLGQSNMSGRGTPTSAVIDPVNPRIFQMKGKDPNKGTVIAAAEPLDMVDVPTGIGPGFQFARRYVAAGLNGPRNVLLVPCAQGGTPLVSTAAPTWNPGTSGSLYDNAVAQATAAAALTGARVVAALWVQGETDGDSSALGNDYLNALTTLVSGIRAAAGVPDLPFIIGQMVSEYLDTGTRQQINAAHLAAADHITGVTFVPGPKNMNLGDGNHYNRTGAVKLAEAMFDAYTLRSVGLPYVPSGVIFDSFIRGDSTTTLGVADTGQTWTYLGPSTWGISSGQAYCVTGTADPMALVDAGSADGAVQVRLVRIDPTHHSRLVFRAASTSDSWMVQRRSTTGKYQLYKKVATVFTQVGTDAPQQAASGDVLRVVLVGSRIRVFLNGLLLWDVTDSFNQTAQLCGIGTDAPSTVVLFDRFRIGA